MSDNEEQAVEQPKTFSEDYVKELRAEAASYRVKAKEIQEEYTTFQQEIEQKQKQSLENEVLTTAESLGMVDPSIAPTLLGDKMDEIHNGADPKEVLESLLSEKPYLKQGTVGKPSSPSENTSKVRLFSKEELRRMSPSEVNRNWEQIQQQLSDGSI